MAATTVTRTGFDRAARIGEGAGLPSRRMVWIYGGRIPHYIDDVRPAPLPELGEVRLYGRQIPHTYFK